MKRKSTVSDDLLRKAPCHQPGAVFLKSPREKAVWPAGNDFDFRMRAPPIGLNSLHRRKNPFRGRLIHNAQ